MPDQPQAPQPIRVAVCSIPARQPDLRQRSKQLAAELDLPWQQDPQQHPRFDMVLAVTPVGLELRVTAPDSNLRGGHGVAADWRQLDVASNMGASFKQPIAKAVGLTRRSDYDRGAATMPTILDATAGLGEDAWLLASLGCTVTAVERHPLIAKLLSDGLSRMRVSEYQRDIAAAGRITPLHADARALLQSIANQAHPPQRAAGVSPRSAPLQQAAGVSPQSAPLQRAVGVSPRSRDAPQPAASRQPLAHPLTSPASQSDHPTPHPPPPPLPPLPPQPDVVYLDPMFPAKRKTAQRKPMRVLRWLAGDDLDADDLLALATRAARRRVVVKRPIHAPPLADIKPTAQHRGKGVRWDIYPIAQHKSI